MNLHYLPPSALAATRALCVGCLLAVALAGCGNKSGKTPATQTAAKVNKEEITVHQINAVLQQQRGLRADQLEAAGSQVLERLIDQELALQAAAAIKLDRDPKVAQAVEAARREIIARAYADKIGEGAAQATPAEVQQYYDANPALFKERRIYQFQEIVLQATPDQLAALRTRFAASKTINDFVDHLKANNVQFTGTQMVRPAEQIPLASLGAVAKMKDGEMQFTPAPNGARIVVLANSRSQPVALDKATPLIEQFLLEQRKRDLITQHLKEQRAAAQIQYVGKYAASAPPPGGAAMAPANAASDSVDLSKGLGK